MPDPSPAPDPVPARATPLAPPRARYFDWWVPGLVVGLVAAAVTAAVAEARRAPYPPVDALTHKVEADVLLFSAKGGDVETHSLDLATASRDRLRHRLLSRELLARALADPAVGELESVRSVADPVAAVAEQLTVSVPAPDVLRVTLCGRHPHDTKVIAEALVMRFVDESYAIERNERNFQTKKLYELDDALRREIEAAEKLIELLGKANNTTGGDDNATRLALLQRRHIEADGEFNKVNREIGKLETEQTVLKRLEATKDAKPDPARASRLIELASVIEVKKEDREKLRAERDALQKLITQGIGVGFHIQAERDGLVPQRAALAKVNVRLTELRIIARLDPPVLRRGEVVVVPLSPRAERPVPVAAWAAAAFTGGFALATAFNFVGLVFGFLRRFA